VAKDDTGKSKDGEGKGRRRVGPRFEQVVRDRLKREGWTPPDEDEAPTPDDTPADASPDGPKSAESRWPTARALWRMPVKVVSYALPILLTIFLIKTFGGLALRWVDIPTDARDAVMRVIGGVTPGARSSIVEKYQVTLVAEPTRERPELVVQVVKYREQVQTLAERIELTQVNDDREPATDERLAVSIGARELSDAVVTGEDGRATIDLRPALSRGRYRRDSTIAVSIGVPATEYQRSYRYAVRDLLRSYYVFGEAPYAATPGGEPDGVTSPDMAYEAVETTESDTYRITLADGSDKWATAPDAEWKAFRPNATASVVAAASLQGPSRIDRQAAQAAAVAAPPPLGVGVTRALLVGVDQYDHHADLANPVGDVAAIEAELRDVYKARVTTLRNPTRHDFLTSLYAQADEPYGPNDQLLVYFAGHGWFDERLRRGFLALRDSRPLEDDVLRDTLVSHEDVRTILERLDCEHVLLVLDSCFSGTVDPTVAMAPAMRAIGTRSGFVSTAEYLERKLAYRTRRYITAGGKEYVPDGRPGQHSPFSRQFLEALRTYGGTDGVLTLEEILVHLERVSPQPKAGELTGNEPGSSFVLVARPAAADENAGPPAEYGTLTVTVTPARAVPTLERIERAQEEGVSASADATPADARAHRFHLRVGSYRVHVALDGVDAHARDVVVDPGEQGIAIDVTDLDGA
jgi:hypothetical protein